MELNLESILVLIGGGLTITGVTAIFFANFRNQSTKQIMDNQTKLIETLTERDDLREKQFNEYKIENEKTLSDYKQHIGKLEGKLELLEKVPLTQISNALAGIEKTQTTMLGLLATSADQLKAVEKRSPRDKSKGGLQS